MKKQIGIIIAISAFVALIHTPAQAAEPAWSSPNGYRVLLTVDPNGVARKNSPASVDIDLPAALKQLGVTGTVDESTIEVIGHDSGGKPRVFDKSRKAQEQFLLPWRTQRYLGITSVTLSLVMPDDKCAQYAVYFDTVESGRGKPRRYPGLVGDGDRFVEGYKRREINGNHFDDFVDFDRDGDLDLFKGGVETYIYYYENVGRNQYVERGRLTNDGKLWSLPQDKQARSWVTVEFCDWDGDGDLDFFPSLAVGYSRDIYRGNTWIYENTTQPGGPLTFTDRGPLLTVSGKPLGQLDSFAGVTFADLDGDGLRDLILARDSMVEFHKNVGTDNDITKIRLADGVFLKANGIPMQVSTARFNVADIDADGDLDLFCGTQHGHIYWFENRGTRTNPLFGTGRIIVNYEHLDAHSGVTVADFDGDGLLDIVTGRFWERSRYTQQPKHYGRLYKNVGTKTHPKFEPQDAFHGSPFTEQFQQCDAVRQNRPRAADWNNDGRTDLVVGDTDGYVWYFRNTTDNLRPVFAPGEKMTAGGQVIRRYKDVSWIGYARCDVTDWNNDGKKDLLVADSSGNATVFLNEGSAAAPKLGEGQDLKIEGVSTYGIGGGLISCDWDSDGKNDLVMAAGDGFYFARNTGTREKPAFAPAKQILFGPNDKGDTPYWMRQSPGSYVDWDGDGKKDFIIGEFEHFVRFLKNVGPGGPGVEPQFADPLGQAIVQPPTGMLVSGADAIDWNGDGDLDIVTGQGHGGSGLRFFERDYINDFVNKTFPVVTVGAAQKRP